MGDTTHTAQFGPNGHTTVERAGRYVNLYHNGDLRLSLSEQDDELLVYDGREEPAAQFDLTTGGRQS